MEAIVHSTRPAVSWGAVLAGVLAALALQILLTVLGLAVGTSAIDPYASNPFAGIGIGTGIWIGLSAIVSLFVGAWVATRLGSTEDRTEGALNGLVVWAFSLVLAVFLTGQGIAGIIGGTASLVKQGASAASENQGVMEDVLERSGATAAPEQPQQRGAQSETEKEVTGALSENTQLSQQQSQNLVDKAQQQLQKVQQRTDARSTGAAIADYSATALWVFFGVLTLMLFASLAGGAAAAPRNRVRSV